MTTIGLVLYPRFTALDIVGPFQTLVDVPGFDVFFIADEVGPVEDHTGRLTMSATKKFDEIDELDVVVVPGGMADSSIGDDDPVVQFVKRIHATTIWTTSVCTGSIFLAHAGILDGLEATNNNARSRGVVMHAADYVSESFIKQHNRLGRSQGCPALPSNLTAEVINLIKDKSCLFIYHPTKSYKSAFAG